MRIIKKLSLFIITCLIITGCDIESKDMENINIYTTTYPINYLITSLYKNNGKVFSIYPTGVDIKNYKISNRKLKEYSESDLFVFNSLDKDRKYAVKMINNNSNLKVIDVATGIQYENKIEELWLNPYNYLMMAENIKNGLNEYINNPYLTEQVNKNYEELEYNISKIDADLTETIDNAPYKIIITDNDLFKFLEKYGLKVISLEDNKNVSINTIEEIEKLIKEKKIKYIYRATKDNNTIIENLIQKYKLQELNINTMYSIDGGITNTNDDYLTIMKNNINLIKGELYKTNY
ncbi:MAG: metal ABC transporter substrate-binding protein [Bacilli bacterium]|nr:metal ABC transporter substrate-binding protein [Bacilli bacterium]